LSENSQEEIIWEARIHTHWDAT